MLPMPDEAIAIGCAAAFARATKSAASRGRIVGLHHQQFVVVDDQRDRCEVALHVVGELVVEHGIDRHGADAR